LSKITDIQLTKLYYSIGEVADMFDVNASLIRFWEKEFTIIKPKKNKKGNRLFTPKDILNFNKIYSLVKEQGYTLEGAKLALKSGELDDDHTPIKSSKNVSLVHSDLISRLEKIKTRLKSLK
jgi:DNA-binding transcriptional MerR regulator